MAQPSKPSNQEAAPASRRYRGYAKSDLKMLEANSFVLQEDSSSTGPAATSSPLVHHEIMSASYTPPTSTEHVKRSPIASTISSSALIAGPSSRPATKGAWKIGVTDRGHLGLVHSASTGSPTQHVPSNKNELFGEDDPMMSTLMPARTSPSPEDTDLASSSNTQPVMRPPPQLIDSHDDDGDVDFEEMELDEEEAEIYARQMETSLLSSSSASPSSSSPSSAVLPASVRPIARLGPPPTTAASSPPISPSPQPKTPSNVPSPPPNPMWFEKTGVPPPYIPTATTSSGSSEEGSNGLNSTKFPSSFRRPRARAGNAQGMRLTYAGTEEEVGLVRRSELARVPIPNYRKDYQVSILIQYSDNSKDVLEYKNRVHPDCTSAEIIDECINKTRKKIQGWMPPADRFGSMELIIPAKTDEDDDVAMDLDTPLWKYCFTPGEVTRLVLRLKMRFAGQRIALKVRLDRGPLRTMMFHVITPISMVIERIQHKCKGTEARGPPFTGLFVFDNKRGHFLENLNKTLADYRIQNADIVQVKRRRLMELCLRDQPKKSLMVPLDLTASLLAEQLHDWLRLDPVDPSTLSLVKIVPKRGNNAELQLVLHATTEVRSFHLAKDDIIQLRRRVSKSTDPGPVSGSVNVTSANSTFAATPSPSAAAPSPLTHIIAGSARLQSNHHIAESRLAKSGSHQISVPINSVASESSSTSGPQSPTSASIHASMKFTAASPSSSTASGLDSSLVRSHVADSMGNVIATFQVAFAGSTHDSESFGSGISATNAYIPGARTRRYPPPKLKEGEVGLFQTVYGIHLWDSSVRITMTGDIHITNYRLVFCSYSDETMSDYFVDVPLTTISRVEKTGDKSKPGLKIECKDFRTLRFHFDRNAKESRRQMRRLLEDCLYPNLKQLFAMAYKSSKSSTSDPNKPDGWSIFDLRREWQRLGVGSGDKGSKWRISTLNETYQFSKTYPSLIVIPSAISDEELVPVFKYRSKGRLPALSWLNSRTGASITRCSQPLSGVTKKMSPDDANLINAIKEAQGSADAKLHLMDARPRANAIANMAMGGGFEVMGGSAYSGCDLEFLNIGNIHVMRNSLSDLKSLLESQPYDNSFLARMEASGWLVHISLILQGSVKIVEHIQQRHSCVLHCSDGWDRTSQLSSIAMILLDPFYRTTKGLCILIEKEWCSFGHKFAQRYGHIAVDHVDKNYAHGERAPIFLQFIDCVYQVLRQFPLAFEFTEAALLCIMEHLYSCHYGTFLFDCERERKAEDISSKTESLWTYILDPDNESRFLNIFYEPFDSVLPLSPTLADVHLWRAYYRRWYAPPDEDKINTEEKVRELVAQNARQAERIAQLELRLSALERQQTIS